MTETVLLLEVVDRLNGVIDKMIQLDARLGRVITALERRTDALREAEERREEGSN